MVCLVDEGDRVEEYLDEKDDDEDRGNGKYREDLSWYLYL